jgi:hypothetical protein
MTSAVTVLSVLDPVPIRVYEDFTTLELPGGDGAS